MAKKRDNNNSNDSIDDEILDEGVILIFEDNHGRHIIGAYCVTTPSEWKIDLNTSRGVNRMINSNDRVRIKNPFLIEQVMNDDGSPSVTLTPYGYGDILDNKGVDAVWNFPPSKLNVFTGRPSSIILDNYNRFLEHLRVSIKSKNGGDENNE